MNYSNQYYTQNTSSQYNTNIPCQSRSSYSLQQYYNNNNNNPKLLGQSRSLSHSNLRSYYNQQQQPQTTTLPSMNNHPVSHPCTTNTRAQQRNANSGIVLQSLSSNPSKVKVKHASMNRAKIISDNNMNANLQQFSKYSQLQLQQVLAQYPPWLQKEYMRRLQRQYEELYVVEDPKIHHWSAICPRKHDTSPDTNTHTHIHDENTCINIISDSIEYLSESATLSPSPYAYSPHHLEDTISPAAHTHTHTQNKAIENLSITLTPPPPPHDAAAASTLTSSKMLTCFEILDYIKKEEKNEKIIKLPTPSCESIMNEQLNNKFDILVEDEDDESDIEEVHDNADNVQSPKEEEQRKKEQVQNGYNNKIQQQQYQQYQQAMQRYYQQKQYQQRLLLQQQALQQQQQAHQQYLMQQNKFVNRYVTQQQQTNQTQFRYYQNQNVPYQNNAHFCA